ncbi:MAG: hypothetical protein HKM28_05105 [Flavobacteriaceae bacterium]|nr:hypothetical protein [Flavobacteriaceae bacterium]
MNTPLHIIDLDFARLELYSNYIISTINEGVLFDTAELNKFYEIFDTYYADRPFGYISNRVYDYTVNPTCLIYALKLPRLAGVAVCCSDQSTYNTANYERTFYRRPFDTFYTLEECVVWIEDKVKQEILDKE